MSKFYCQLFAYTKGNYHPYPLSNFIKKYHLKNLFEIAIDKYFPVYYTI